jgi:hypothetical protein
MKINTAMKTIDIRTKQVKIVDFIVPVVMKHAPDQILKATCSSKRRAYLDLTSLHLLPLLGEDVFQRPVNYSLELLLGGDR